MEYIWLTGVDVVNDRFKAKIPAGVPYERAMLDRSKMRAVIYTRKDISTVPDVQLLVSGTSRAAIVSRARTAPDNPQVFRGNVNRWLTTAGYPPLPVGATTLEAMILYVIRLGMPGVGLFPPAME